MKLHTISFGCQMNIADSEEMSRALNDKGFQVTSEQENADAILINTCTVRQHAEDKAFSLVGTLKDWKAKDPNRLLIIAGCAAERTKKNLQHRFPHVDLVVGAKSIEQFPEIIDEALKEKYDWGKDNENTWPQDTPHPALSPKGRGENGETIAYVTTMRGCNYSCTYCIVPYVRGREIYRTPEAILNEVRQRVAAGAKEIMFLGQTVNSYRGEGENGIWNFARLIREAGKIEGVKRIRFMSPHPYYMSDELISAMAETPAVCRHLHLPLQSGSDRILNLMQRNYTAEKYRQIIHKLREAIPGMTITTDIIAGFPGETERDFEETLAFIKEMNFDGAYCFKYSAREGTKAAEMEGHLPEEVIEQRHVRLLELVETLGAERTKQYEGKIEKVLVDKATGGKTETNRWVELHGEQVVPGAILNVQITVKNRKLIGNIVEQRV